MRRMARTPKAAVAARSVRKYSGMCVCMLDIVSNFGSGLPAFKPNQPDTKCGKTQRHRNAQQPKSNSARSRRPGAVSVRHVLVGIHQVAVESGGNVVGVARRLLGLELIDPRG